MILILLKVTNINNHQSTCISNHKDAVISAFTSLSLHLRHKSDKGNHYKDISEHVIP